ncbi:MAG TPA: ABC transporter ATP-binding protein [Alphaproteobacteria bacterium]|jgi:lipoprotein-releasing system ATP-binding protein|nr:ABC transporter ATP-binding protein [Alphaproteobacteria bacterium]MCB9984875.1 ABC transporter ATP-binding protein [Micavibrio sp.]HPQ50695.1 ABC transporter ATP-binding protein [Alphaproteobacteria bacterium]HRK97267.1 ABC transporter ATP-binding protein [Alphaproteobacteria bacterium]
MSKVLLQVKGLEKTHHQGEMSLTIFKDVSLSISAGEIVALVGPSGAGKSTLLQMVGLLDKPTDGQVFIDGQNVSELNDHNRTLLRRKKLGFVYQFHFLQPEFSAVENVMIPQMIAGVSKDQAWKNVEPLLVRLGLGHRFDHRPARLSGGEQQRVAIARALANNPSILLADEPTGNLDPKTAGEVFNLLIEQSKSSGIGALIATHNMDLAQKMDRILVMDQGMLKEV